MAVDGKNFGLFVVHAVATVTAVAPFDVIVSAVVTILQPFSFFCSTLLNVYIFYTSPSRTSSTGRCRGFAKSFPSLTVSSCCSYSFPFISPLQNHPYPFFPNSFRVFLSCVIACQAVWGYLPSPILTECPNHLNCANYGISFMELFLVPFICYNESNVQLIFLRGPAYWLTVDYHDGRVFATMQNACLSFVLLNSLYLTASKFLHILIYYVLRLCFIPPYIEILE